MIAKDYQGASLNGKHTLKDYGLIVGNTDIVGLPKPKTIYIDVPGSSNRIDLSSSLTGRIEYENRTLRLMLGGTGNPMRWPSKVSRVLRDLHGRTVKVILDIDPSFYYEGRCKAVNFERNQRLGQIELEIDAAPFKMDLTASDEDWLWDSFSFEEGIIREYMDIQVSGQKEYFVLGYPYPVTPVFRVEGKTGNGSLYVARLSKTFELQNGMNRFPEIEVGEEGDAYRFYGNYTVSISLRGRYL